MWGALREEKVVQMLAIDMLLLAHLISEEMPQLPSTSQPDSYSPT